MMQKSRSCFEILALMLVGCLVSCNPQAHKIDPTVYHETSLADIHCLPSPFSPLTEEELETDWGREYLIANHFGPDFDLYRAITGYKRALILLPPEKSERRMEIEYYIVLCYYLGGKYQLVVEEFEKSTLCNVTTEFPPFQDLLIILEHSYEKTGGIYRSQIFHNLIQQCSPDIALNLEMSKAIVKGDLSGMYLLAENHPQGICYQKWFCDYQMKTLSVRKAQMLNAIFPGAGYYYTGQRRTAITSFILNAAFIAATVELFRNGYPAAGAITASLEFGWYFGGINGAGLSAKNYNDILYNTYAKDAMEENKLFPVMMLQYAF